MSGFFQCFPAGCKEKITGNNKYSECTEETDISRKDTKIREDTDSSVSQEAVDQTVQQRERDQLFPLSRVFFIEGFLCICFSYDCL